MRGRRGGAGRRCGVQAHLCQHERLEVLPEQLLKGLVGQGLFRLLLLASLALGGLLGLLPRLLHALLQLLLQAQERTLSGVAQAQPHGLLPGSAVPASEGGRCNTSLTARSSWSPACPV